RHERFWYERRGRGPGIWTRRHRAGAFRARRRRGGKRRPWTCVSHSELAADLKSFSADALDLPAPRPVEPARQVVARYLDNCTRPAAERAAGTGVWTVGNQAVAATHALAVRPRLSHRFAMELTPPPYYWRPLPFTCRSAQPLCNSAATTPASGLDGGCHATDPQADRVGVCVD